VEEVGEISDFLNSEGSRSYRRGPPPFIAESDGLLEAPGLEALALLSAEELVSLHPDRAIVPKKIAAAITDRVVFIPCAPLA
jgi:hypothetical protein